jgi:hypothetical protein
MIDYTGPDTPLFNFALFMAGFAIITLGVTLLYIENADSSSVLVVGIVNIIFFFSTGCAVAVGAGSGCTDASHNPIHSGDFANSTVALFGAPSSGLFYLALLRAYRTVDGYRTWCVDIPDP